MKIQLMTSKRGTVLMLAFGLLLTLTKASSKLKAGDKMYLTDQAKIPVPSISGMHRLYEGYMIRQSKVQGKYNHRKVTVRYNYDASGAEQVRVRHTLSNIICPQCDGTGMMKKEKCPCDLSGKITFDLKIPREHLQHFKKGSIVCLSEDAPEHMRGTLVGDLTAVGDGKDGVLVSKEGSMPIEVKREFLRLSNEQELTERIGELLWILGSKFYANTEKCAACDGKGKSGLFRRKCKQCDGQVKQDDQSQFILSLTQSELNLKKRQLAAIQGKRKTRRRLMDRLHTSEKNGRAC